MNPMFKYNILLSSLALGACTQINTAVDFATTNGSIAVAQGVAGECLRSVDARKATYAIYVAEEAKVRPGKPTALKPLDCDGDGQPDF